MTPTIPQYKVDYQKEVRNLIWENLPTDKNRTIAMFLYFDYTYDILDFSSLGEGSDFKFCIDYERTVEHTDKEGITGSITQIYKMYYN
jgi:hypothetical protein